MVNIYKFHHYISLPPPGFEPGPSALKSEKLTTRLSPLRPPMLSPMCMLCLATISHEMKKPQQIANLTTTTTNTNKNKNNIGGHWGPVPKSKKLPIDSTNYIVSLWLWLCSWDHLSDR